MKRQKPRSDSRSIVSDLVGRRDYDRVAEILDRARRHAAGESNSGLERALDAVWHLSLACGRCRAESNHQRQGYVDARRRETALRGELRSALDAIGDTLDLIDRATVGCDGDPGAPAVRLATSSDTTETSLRSGDTAIQPTLAIYCLGVFRVQCGNRIVTHWSNTKAKSILKYLVTRRRRLPVSREALMELFWPDAAPESARNNLNVALFGLRQAVAESGCSPLSVLFRDGCYGLNPDIPLWIDYEVFRSHMAKGLALDRGGGEHAAARHEFETAEMLYRGDFAEESRHEEWLAPLRQSLRADYRRLLEKLGADYLRSGDHDRCVRVSSKMLGSDPCDEEAHRRLMLCYERRGLPHLALRQYQTCVEALRRELQTSPSAETEALAKRLRERRAS